MGIIRNQLALKIRGRVGAFSYYTESGRQIVRQAQNTTNYGETARRTESQQMRRAKWGNLVNFYKISKDWMPHAYETKKSNQSDYNKFMSLNTSIVQSYLQKGMIAVGGCVVEPYVISEGSIRTIDVLKLGNAWRTDIALGKLEIKASTTVAAFTEAVLAVNPHIREGFQLSFISYQQELLPNRLPQVICTAYEVTLDSKENSLLRTFLPEFCSQSVDGYIGTNDNISKGCFAYIWSYSGGGKTIVSTQTLVNNNTDMIDMFTTFQAYNASIQSYGLDKERFLMSGSNPVKGASQPNWIASVGFGGQLYVDGSTLPAWGLLYVEGADVIILFANEIEGELKHVRSRSTRGGLNGEIQWGVEIVDGRVVVSSQVAYQLANGDNDYVTEIIVSTSLGDYSIHFLSSDPEIE